MVPTRIAAHKHHYKFHDKPEVGCPWCLDEGRIFVTTELTCIFHCEIRVDKGKVYLGHYPSQEERKLARYLAYRLVDGLDFIEASPDFPPETLENLPRVREQVLFYLEKAKVFPTCRDLTIT